MTTKTLPVPLTIEVPNDQWHRVEPERYGVENVAAMLVRESGPDDYAPTITVSGDVRTDAPSAEQVADEAIAIFKERSESVELIGRKAFEAGEVIGVTQHLACSAVVVGKLEAMRVFQTVMQFTATDGSGLRGFVIHTATCTAEQVPEIAPEYQKYIALVRVATPDEVAETEETDA